LALILIKQRRGKRKLKAKARYLTFEKEAGQRPIKKRKENKVRRGDVGMNRRANECIEAGDDEYDECRSKWCKCRGAFLKDPLPR
jgi:hypothetical protein